MKKIRKGDTSLHISCYVCDQRAIRATAKSNFFDAELLIKEATKRDKGIIKQLKHDMLDLNAQREAELRHLKDLQRENEVLHKERTDLLTKSKFNSYRQ